MTLLTRAPEDQLVSRQLLEREHERQAIDDSLAGLDAGIGSVLVIEGEAGIGKSTLARYALDGARQRGLRIVQARGGELEKDAPYGIAIELFGPLTRDVGVRGDLFAGPAGRTSGLFGLGSSQGLTERADSSALVHGLFWLVLNVVEDGPLLLVVDDAQWADDPSLRLLLHLAQRIEDVPVLLVVALRATANAEWAPPIVALRSLATATQLLPAPLTEAAVGALLAMAGRSPDADVERAIWLATTGNPFFVRELVSALEQRGPDTSDADAIRAIVPERVGRTVTRRLAGLEINERRLAEAVAVLGDAATFSRCRDLAGLDSASAEQAIGRLVAGSILDDAVAVAFRHPIVASSVYASIPGPVRAARHRQAALLLADVEAPLGDVAAQLRQAEPCGDPRIVDLLLAAASEAASRGEPSAAASLLRRALEEPPALAQRRGVLTLLASTEAAIGAPTATATFRAAIELVDDSGERADLLLELGHALISGGQWPAAREAFEQGLAIDGADPEVRARLEAGYLSSSWVAMNDRTEIEARVRRVLAAEDLGAANRELAVWIAFQQGATVSATAPEMAALVKRALAEAPLEVLITERQLVEVAAGVLVESDELEFELEFLTLAIGVARRTGALGKAGTYAYCRSWPNYFMGRLADAVADTEEARRAAELGWETFLPAAATVGALAHIERGELDAAEEALALDPERWGHRIDGAMLVPLARGRLALARGDAAAAVEQLRDAGTGAARAFMRNTVPTDWRSWLGIALALEGERDEARAVAHEGVDVARQWGARWGLGSALRAAGVVEGGAHGIELLREAGELLRDGPARLEHGRALVDLGAALRRNGSRNEARQVLSQAVDLCRQLGARALLDRGLVELQAAGARPRRLALTGVESLTPSELRVAREAATGRTNREIAQALFVTPKAVEFHLANAYRKLQIGARGQLPAALRAV